MIKSSCLLLGCFVFLILAAVGCDSAADPTAVLPTSAPPQPSATKELTPIPAATQMPTIPETQGGFTGGILPVFYVSDMRKSVQFYRDVLGFEFHHYWNYDENEPVREWKVAEPPVYAEMAASDQKFSLHLAQTPYETQVGGVIHYFRVRNVDAHYRQLKNRGGEPDPLIDRPWMRMFSIVDPDGHKLFFYTPPKQASQ